VHRPRTGKRIGGIGAFYRRQHRHRIVDRQRKDRDAIERAAGGNDTGCGNKTAARLEPDDIAERGRHAARSGRIGAERKRRDAGADRKRRAGARPAGNELGIEQIARNAIGRAHTDETGRELVEIGLAEDDRTGRTQPRHGGGVSCRAIAVSRARRRGRHALDVDIVLHRDRDAVKRKVPVAGTRELLRLGENLGFLAQRDEHRRIVMRADAREATRDDVLRLGRPGAIDVEDLGDRLGHVRLRNGTTKRPGNRVRRFLLCQFRAISQVARPVAPGGAAAYI
jgi:hypothetical protein